MSNAVQRSVPTYAPPAFRLGGHYLMDFTTPANSTPMPVKPPWLPNPRSTPLFVQVDQTSSVPSLFAILGRNVR